MGELKPQGNLVFGLDIGTRSIVGTVGYREGDIFNVVGQEIREHETRAMLDGQIHDIAAVGNTISVVKRALEKDLEVELTDVCIAAAGRVLETVQVNATWELDNEKVITPEEVATLTSMAIEKAYRQFQEQNQTNLTFYCVGNSVVRYYLNGYTIGNLENHKARSIGADIIATFLPEDVVDGLYRAVEMAGLRVVNMTLEPIAAISVAIPEMYRMLNIGLVDVGAGTSDICITKDGCIIAYGMIPCAGDFLTEAIARGCLVDFNTAEQIKRSAEEYEEIEYKDIMGLSQMITRDAVLEMVDSELDEMTRMVADKFKELNGGKPVSAVFVVGGGGRMYGYTKKLSDYLGIVAERVAVRGEDVMQKIRFKEEDVRKDSLMVTPIGICLNYYEQSNNFIHVTFNDSYIKIYDSGNLAVVDAAMNANFSNDGLFPRRGRGIAYTINGRHAIKRGALGEAAQITVNGEMADMHTAIRANDVIAVKESTAGEAAKLLISDIPEYKDSITVYVNGSHVQLPKFAYVNGELKSQFYDVQDGDEIVMQDFYTVKQILDFMDIIPEAGTELKVNHQEADFDTKVYENFTMSLETKKEAGSSGSGLGAASYADLPEDDGTLEEDKAEQAAGTVNEPEEAADTDREVSSDGNREEDPAGARPEQTADDLNDTAAPEVKETASAPRPSRIPKTIVVDVNGQKVTLTGKAEYVYVDIFNFIDFKLQQIKGKHLVTLLNGERAEYMHTIQTGDTIVVRWEDH